MLAEEEEQVLLQVAIPTCLAFVFTTGSEV